MSIQQLLAQIQGLGITEATGSNLGDLTQGQIQTGIGSQYSTAVQDMLNPQMFQELSPQLLKGASMSAYSPMFQQEQQNLMGDLMSSMQGQDVAKSMGGFAGTGMSQFAQAKAKDVYGKGMQGVVGRAVGAKTESLKTLQSIIDQWQSTAQSFTSAA